jgi:hypothetical protein
MTWTGRNISDLIERDTHRTFLADFGEPIVYIPWALSLQNMSTQDLVNLTLAQLENLYVGDSTQVQALTILQLAALSGLTLDQLGAMSIKQMVALQNLAQAQLNSGNPVTIRAIIDREVATAIPGFAGSANYKHEVQIANSAKYGVIWINKGKDKIQMSTLVGGPLETFTVLQILKNDQGFWHLGVG